MNETESEETRSFRDPMASRMEAARKRKEALDAEYPQVRDVYDGFYETVTELSAEGAGFLLGAEGIIGSELALDAEQLSLIADGGRVLTTFKGKARERLAAHLADKWHVKVYLGATFFHSETRSGSAELALICWAPLKEEYEASLETFSRNIASRLASGDRAGLKLTQDQFINVLRSDGSWYLTPTKKREPLPKGTVVYKARRTAIERLTGFALKHRMGCNLLAIVFWLMVLGGIAFLVWTLFFS